MSLEPVYISAKGLEKLKAELHELKTVKRRKAADRIEVAKEMGDLSENAEYHDAKDAAAFIDGRVMELDDIIPKAVIIQAGKTDRVSIGSKVTVTFKDKEKVFTIVGSQEADPLQGLISNVSPIGQALLGKKVDDVAEVEVPAGKIVYKIKSIS